jgi:hypothetical protein
MKLASDYLFGANSNVQNVIGCGAIGCVIQFAMKICMADEKMEIHENIFINKLYDSWGLE